MSSLDKSTSKFIKTMIVDDDDMCRTRLKRLLKSYDNILLIGEAVDGLDALKKIDEYKPALVFMDIDMPRLNGIEAARSLGVSKPLIVFVSAYEDYAIKAFELSATDYLLKPVLQKRLALTMEKVVRLLKQGGPYPFEEFLTSEDSFRHNARISFAIGKEIVVIDMMDIIAITVESRYAKIYYGDKNLLIDESLSSLMTRISPKYFIWANRSAIVNTRMIESLKHVGLRKYTLKMRAPFGQEISVSRGQINPIKKSLGKSTA